MTINELAEQIQTGNETEPVLTELYQHIQRIVKLQNLSYEDKEDMAQDVYLFIVGVIRTGHAENAEAYMRRVIYNKTATRIMKLQRARRQNVSISTAVSESSDVNVGELLRDKTPLVSETLVENERRKQLRGLIEELPEKFREVAQISFIDDLSPREAQKRLGLTPTQYRLTKSKGKHTLINIAKKREKIVWKQQRTEPQFAPMLMAKCA